MPLPMRSPPVGACGRHLSPESAAVNNGGRARTSHAMVRATGLARASAVTPLYLTYLNALDVEALALTDDEILGAIEHGLAAQGRGETVIEPRMHLIPDKSVDGHFNVLRGAYRDPISLAGVKV